MSAVSAALDSWSDDSLVAACTYGDAEAFEELYRRYADDVTGYFCNQVRSRVDAQDLTQEVFLKVWAVLQGEEERAPFPTENFGKWLFAVVARYQVKRHRWDLWSQFTAVRQLEEDAQRPCEPADRETPLSPALAEALARLPEKHRQMLLLRFADGRTQREVQQEMGYRSKPRWMEQVALEDLRRMLRRTPRGVQPAPDWDTQPVTSGGTKRRVPVARVDDPGAHTRRIYQDPNGGYRTYLFVVTPDGQRKQRSIGGKTPDIVRERRNALLAAQRQQEAA